MMMMMMGMMTASDSCWIFLFSFSFSFMPFVILVFMVWFYFFSVVQLYLLYYHVDVVFNCFSFCSLCFHKFYVNHLTTWILSKFPCMISFVLVESG